MSKDQGKRLQKAIDSLMTSYKEHPDIEHIGDMNIPAQIFWKRCRHSYTQRNSLVCGTKNKAAVWSVLLDRWSIVFTKLLDQRSSVKFWGVEKVGWDSPALQFELPKLKCICAHKEFCKLFFIVLHLTSALNYEIRWKHSSKFRATQSRIIIIKP